MLARTPVISARLNERRNAKTEATPFGRRRYPSRSFPAATTKVHLLQNGGDGGAELRGSFHCADAGCCHGGVFILRGALTAADDRACVPHAAAWRRSLACDEADHGLFHVGFDPCRSLFFRVAADLANQNYGVGVGIVVEKLDGIEKRRADDGIAADADASGLADAEKRQLVDGFVGESAAAADDADVSLLVNATGHDPDFAFPRRNDAGAVGTDHARLLEIHGGGYADHVEDRNAFGDTDNERQARVG